MGPLTRPRRRSSRAPPALRALTRPASPLQRALATQACTFRPRVAPAAPPRKDADSAAVIKGMEAFTQRQAEARKKRAEKEAAAAAEEAALTAVRCSDKALLRCVDSSD